MNMVLERQLAVPAEIKERCPLTMKMSDTIGRKRTEIKEVFEGRDNRKLLIIGPCSADNEDSVIDYIGRLARIQEKVEEKILIVPRIYTNKPRTTGEGYKGMLHQPDPTEKPDMIKGIIATRHLHMRAVEETGFVCADEMLYPENYQYLDDVLGYIAVGARSVENQQHRLVASGVDVPVGMKNPTSGDYTVMMNAILAAQHGHTFIYRGWEAHSQGNPLAHSILRGYTNKHGQSQPNYHYEDLIRLCDYYDERELSNPAVIIDTNHSNSNKNPYEQPRIIKDVLHSGRQNERIDGILKGFMVESYIEDGNQKVGGGCYGKSITDPCLGWDKTEKLIYEIADLI
ncbi:3-deoxy-7-phosphoheptulonate synthase [Lacrimispora saccharolytica]|uniref:3-deoxy-7-phosphoheptulonate synthase n=1 Tax=Lacrimispora saccharolytica TaxID=84030 RepID=UPI00265D5251|nr:3-deoxy-7-phosphoheptulonate synthase [Lacrimispora saccharolytica]MCF2655841.1 3-deoxy-7-phosphoheptulonate synthase [Lacrimispora saccharolytica]MCI7557800.1 3-deoxy-7-phosphoheptulonate synthase [Lachnospiraceae bacterium]MDD7548743.1 3-deoxy-7-phosphoheptulonate synthase [Lachnospiraceae bacterium]